MIRVNLLIEEYLSPEQGEKNTKKLEAIESIKGLLSQIDHRVEKLPLEDSGRFLALLTSLKGAPLTHEERQLSMEISG